jgi:hypothetical protein
MLAVMQRCDECGVDKPPHRQTCPRSLLTAVASAVSPPASDYLTAVHQIEQDPGVTSDDVQKIAAAFGRLGGKARAARLTPERRREIAQRAARARWKTPD